MQSLFMMMLMSSYEDVDANLYFPIKMPLANMPWSKCVFSWRKCNLTKNFFYFPNRGFFRVWNQNAFKTRFIFFKDHSFLFRWGLNAQCIILATKNMFYFDLRLPQKLMITVRNLWMRCKLEIKWSGSKNLFSQFG